MNSVSDRLVSEGKLGLLIRAKARSIRNHVVETTARAPIRVGTAAGLVFLIWFGLYWLFRAVFFQFEQTTPLEATVALPMVFNFFFLSLLALLTFSNAIIAHGSLFAKREAEYLLASPLLPRDVVMLKYFESLAFSSWSLILLGLPLMFAMAEMSQGHPSQGTIFFVLFLAFYLAFIPIPGALGLVLAWVVARFLPRKAIRLIAVVGGVVLTIFFIWGMGSLKFGDADSEAWLRSFLGKMSFVEMAFLPNNWVSSGIDHTLNHDYRQALLYLSVTLSNALFLSYAAVRIVSASFGAAYNRAAGGRNENRLRAAPASGGICGAIFFYLPLRLKLIAAKDLRTFFRDPLQWSQLAILFGLVFLYLSNLPSLQMRFSSTSWGLFIPFLNLCSISFILATFTCRFVFPLVSLEGQQLWLVGLLPMPRGKILQAKFAFAMTVTLLVTCGAMGWAIVMLELPATWAVLHLATTFAICYGLCGLAVGLGGRLATFDETNAARIANGLGGTVNLLASLVLVGIVLVAMGYATWRCYFKTDSTVPDSISTGLCIAAMLFSMGVGHASLMLGARHFNRVEA